MQDNNFFIDNIMLHWEADGSLKIEVHDWRCTLHTCENDESLWHAKIKNAKEN